MSKIPGFRSGKKWKKVIATTGYLFIALIVYAAVSGDGSKKVTTTPVASAPASPSTPTKTPEQIAKEKADADAAAAKAKAEADTKAKADAEAKAKEIPGTIGLKPDEFKDKWNASATSMNMPALEISKINIENGQAQDTFKFQFNNSHGLVGTVNKADGSVRDVIIVASGKGLANTKSATDVILSWGALIQTTNPGLSASERGIILKDVGAMGDNVNFKNADKSTVRGNIKYHLQSSDTLGIWFSASDVKDGK